MKPDGKGTRHALTDKNAVAHPGTAKIFFRPYMDPVEMPDANYDLWLCTGRLFLCAGRGRMPTGFMSLP